MQLIQTLPLLEYSLQHKDIKRYSLMGRKWKTKKIMREVHSQQFEIEIAQMVALLNAVLEGLNQS